jgi:hypothetical protein
MSADTQIIFRRPRTIAGALTLAALLVSGGAPAQTDPVAATELFKQGRDAVVRNDHATACPLFEESNRLDARVGTLLNLADCEERIGKLAEALQHWHQAIQLGTATNDRRAEEARSRQAALDARVPRLTIHLADGAPRSMELRRNGVPLGRAAMGVPLPLNPGEHVVEARAPGYEPRRFRVTVSESESKDLQVTVGPRLPEPPPEKARSTPSQPNTTEVPDDTVAYVLGGIGVAGVIVGSVTGMMLWGKNRTIDAQCNARNECSEDGLEAVDDAKGLLPISNAAWVIGVVGIGASTYLFVTSGPSQPSTTGELTSSVPRQGIGMHLRGEF